MKNFKLITSALLSLMLSSSLAVNVSAIGRPSPSDPENHSLIDPEDASVVWPYNHLIEITSSDGSVYLCDGYIGAICVLSESDVPTTSEEIRDIIVNERFRGAVVETDGEPYVIVFEFDYENKTRNCVVISNSNVNDDNTSRNCSECTRSRRNVLHV